MIIYVEATLGIGFLIVRAVVLYGHIGVPLDIAYGGIFGHKSSEYGVAAGGLDYPVGVFLIELAVEIGHFRLNPDAELKALLFGRLEQVGDAVGKLGAVYFPVAETPLVAVAGIFGAEPAVVEHEQFSAHVGYVGHHLVYNRLVNIEVYAFPRVEEYWALAVGVLQPVVAAPAVYVAAHARGAALAVCECHGGSLEGLAFGKAVCRVVGVDAGSESVPCRGIGVDADVVVAAVAEHSAYGAAGTFLRFSVEAQHDFGVCVLRVACSVDIADSLDAGSEGFVCEMPFVAPGAVDMAQPYIAPAHGQIGRRKLGESHGFVLIVPYFSPCLYHVACRPCAVAYVDIEGIESVF